MQDESKKPFRNRLGPPLNHRKNSNAQKHGVYCHVAILPGEDPLAYAALYDELVKEWAPDGVTEEDAVASIAKAKWAKGRIVRFRIGKIMECTLGGSHPAFDRIKALRSLCLVLEQAPDSANEIINNRLSRDLQSRLKQELSGTVLRPPKTMLKRCKVK
jgi:hypothetical protein